MMYRPVPPGFAEAFVRLGWTGVKLEFRAHARTVKRWLEVCGRDGLRARRAEYIRQKRAERNG